MKARTLPITLLLMLGLVAGAHAQVYRCVEDGTGRITFSDMPCHGKATGREIDVTPNTLDASAGREQALRSEVQELREKLREQQQTSQTDVTGRTQADLQATRFDSKACEDARWYYESETRTNPNNEAAIDAKRSAMFGACGMKEPDRVEVRRNVVVRQELAPVPRSMAPAGLDTRCNGSDCRDSAGNHFQKDRRGTLHSPNGPCRFIGKSLHCP
ncbi:DUF4124 domain-containing protein [Azoarcus sp. DN11]|uniref:DUF4124 domain-containing protein n=1 Tax=Azoarcus sp. DN11 TaxID=356837 RepID=UPI000EB410C4|nr:DUF4124 domain-containing protein [Azoarcus sp. DN11]AYH45890.1 hypothetical protein CDA09_21305 [Azoarcus sp. DN11]